VSSDTEPSASFEPLRPASSGRLLAAILLGPVLWLVALVVAAWLVARTWAIELGLVVTLASFLVSLVVLAAIRAGRRRQEKRYVERG
jgi:membrane protein implicated in regulation of membrane protease activity